MTRTAGLTRAAVRDCQHGQGARPAVREPAIETMLGLALAGAAVAFGLVCYTAGLYPRAAMPPREDPALTAMRDSVLTEAEIHTAQLAALLDHVRRGARPDSHHLVAHRNGGR
jgi:hypothetical protein